MAHQIYIQEDKLTDTKPLTLFSHCVRKAKEKNLLNSSYTHSQWANLLFPHEMSNMRSEYMSVVKREYSIYFARVGRSAYTFEAEKIERDFPSLLGVEEEDEPAEGSTCEDVVHETIKALNNEIKEQKNPDNIESFKGADLALLKKQGKSYIYTVRLVLSDGQEPHFHDGIPFELRVYGKKVNCEAVEFDYVGGTLFFTSKHYLQSASYCTIRMDSTFILDSLRVRLADIEKKGVNDKLPYTKFFFSDETEDLKNVAHKDVPMSLKEGLDETQGEAFDAAIDKDITFIWGPPGTGKSFTLAAIIYALYKLGEERTVVCCLSNVAVDQLLCKVLDIIERNGDSIEPGNIYRAGATMEKRIIDTDYLFPKNKLTDDLRARISANNEKLRRLKNQKQDMSDTAISLKADNKDKRKSLKEETDNLVKSSRIVFSTISNFVLSSNLSDSPFDNLIVDEASMLSMPSLMALGSKITKRLIMVGDFQQLSPIALVKDEILTDSVFEMSGININNTSHPALHQLLHQRRSHEIIVNLINAPFYNGKLIPMHNTTNDIIKARPFSGRVISLKQVKDGAVRFTKGGTRQNKAFAMAVMDLLDEFCEEKKAKFSIGIITPYKGQVALLKALKYERDYPERFNERIKIGTVHTFQGSECDVVIFDMVDCAKLDGGKPSRIGRLYAGEAGERLINVAVSRAKHKLIVVCDPSYIRNIPGGTVTEKTFKMFERLSHYV